MMPSTAGRLFVVSTPIGNLEDITLRALRVLREADLIAAEDTRRTARLLAHHAIPTSTVSFHEHNTQTRIPQLVARLSAGARVALVTDAGTPGVSDPGLELVRACVAAKIVVDPIPGPSALLAAGVVAGFPMSPFTFLGFPPVRSKDRTRWFTTISEISWTLVFFEAPHRISRTIDEAAKYLGNRQIVLARELTKIHQEFIRGTAQELGACLSGPRGEFTVVVGPLDKEVVGPKTTADDAQLFVEFGELTDFRGLQRRAAIAALAKKHGRRTREVYAAIERSKQVG
jgi:16S rRNA (cytidine1402-2'-O)-methyltransferase